MAAAHHLSPYGLETVVGSGASGIVHSIDELTVGKLIPIADVPLEVSAPGDFVSVRYLGQGKILIGSQLFLLQDQPYRQMHLAQKEIAILKSLLGVPGIVQIRGTHFVNIEGTLNYVIALHLVPGKDFQELSDEPYSLADVGKMLFDMTIILSELGSKGIIHSDVKPENIMYQEGEVCGTGKTTLIDFSAAHYADTIDKEYITSTVEYASPEHLRDSLTLKSDVFSLGVVARTLLLWGEELTERHRFRSKDGIHKAHLRYLYHYTNRNRDVLVTDMNRRGIPAELSRAVGICLDSDPVQRTAEALCEETYKLAQGRYSADFYQFHHHRFLH